MNRHRLTIVLWTALALIGLQLASGNAQAHEGHAHPAPAAHHVAMHADHVTGHNLLPPATAPAPVASELSAAGGNDQPDGVAASCNGACCTAGFSCCGSAMAAVQAAFGPPSLRGLVMAIRAGPTGLGLDPEALPKPPKSFV